MDWWITVNEDYNRQLSLAANNLFIAKHRQWSRANQARTAHQLFPPSVPFPHLISLGHELGQDPAWEGLMTELSSITKYMYQNTEFAARTLDRIDERDRTSSLDLAQASRAELAQALGVVSSLQAPGTTFTSSSASFHTSKVSAYVRSQK